MGVFFWFVFFHAKEDEHKQLEKEAILPVCKKQRHVNQSTTE